MRKIRTVEQISWQHMKQRCLNPKNRSYSDYGARGIIFDPRWNSFDNFLLDMELKPDPSYTIERRDNNKGYSKENCYWGTRQDQARNKRNNTIINGKTKWEWAKELDLKFRAFDGRLKRFRRGEITEAQLLSKKVRDRKGGFLV